MHKSCCLLLPFAICKSRKKINLLPAYLFRVVQL
nr:MAG TPA: hypothetical protein [Inoviridae sp.]